MGTKVLIFFVILSRTKISKVGKVSEILKNKIKGLKMIKMKNLVKSGSLNFVVNCEGKV